MEPLVSVIIPAYNHASFVKECLDSVLNEGYPNIEIVIIDDGSQDGTAEQIERWIKDHDHEIPIKFISQENSGVSKVLNRCIALARGEYILPLASDDGLISGGIASRVNFLNAHHEYGAVFGDCMVVDNVGSKIFSSGIFEMHGVRKGGYLQSSHQLAKEIIWRWAVPGPVVIYRKSYLCSLGGFNNKRKVEDWDIYLRMVADGRVAYLDEVVSYYRLHSFNASKNNESRVRRIHFELLKTAFANLSYFSGELRFLLIKKTLVILYILLMSYFGKKI
ncbi:glycosyltransferase [Craterilacuibacter sp. RT1T]|uniref:glycosyltransferase n=1 Tax=Craterilacuibacter sp. RT1T TaxID=2942211 RepID=UPI0020C03500|nr:glycosyltransferase [Craterilacuibacter sp. RT1T]MCL6263677.1 glycosyltransferase [Craterilacuibacter sp. RT1T]